MTAKSSCPNGRRLWAEVERLRAQWEEARKRRAALEAEVRRGRRSAAPFSRDEPIPGRESAARGGHRGDGGSAAGGVSGVWGTPELRPPFMYLFYQNH
jgi:hypothetical protein